MLYNLYESYFKNGGNSTSVSIDHGDNETFLAYKYLKEKGFIDFWSQQVGDRIKYTAKITVKGIDEFESME